MYVDQRGSEGATHIKIATVGQVRADTAVFPE
jgi:hypothetical protein